MAFGIWDRETKKLFIARDRTGEKPLYYWHDENKFLLRFRTKIPTDANTRNSPIRPGSNRFIRPLSIRSRTADTPSGSCKITRSSLSIT
ncbi:MAG TPA: hypothetical protein DDW76_02265 [Cyanobacteria bacterium UBA11369]|nr:hypothetical protein [Cyanobacteria bacterium UBA11369]